MIYLLNWKKRALLSCCAMCIMIYSLDRLRSHCTQAQALARHKFQISLLIEAMNWRKSALTKLSSHRYTIYSLLNSIVSHHNQFMPINMSIDKYSTLDKYVLLFVHWFLTLVLHQVKCTHSIQWMTFTIPIIRFTEHVDIWKFAITYCKP